MQQKDFGAATQALADHLSETYYERYPESKGSNVILTTREELDAAVRRLLQPTVEVVVPKECQCKQCTLIRNWEADGRPGWKKLQGVVV